MADPRTFVLIGDFQDNITPALESINNSIAGLKRTMSAMSTRRGGGFSDVTQSVGKLVSAQIHLKDAIEGVGKAAKEATAELKEYKNVVGKVASAHYHIARAGQQAGDKIASGYDKAVASARELKREDTSVVSARRQRDRSLASAVSSPGPSIRSTRSYASAPPAPMRNYGGRGLGEGGSFDMARFTLTFGLSEAIAAPITGAITAGFQIGVGMMMKPFEYFMNGMQERMEDEMSDLKAASGFFSINKMSEKKFLERGTFQEAIDFMQKNNALMAKLAGSLPGSTQDFIEVNKRISDSIAQLVTNAPERAMILAEKIRSQETSTAYSSIGPITGAATSKKMQDAMQILMADLTKQTVLAGQGTGAGRGGAMGAYGLPQLTERMLSQQDISMGQMQRYAAIFRDPMIMRNLEKELPKISATMANTPERYEALRVFFEKVLPPELVERYRRTLMGVQETFNTAIFSPETGIFGLGRKMKELGGAYDEFGRMLDKNGDVTKDITEQMRIDIDIYGLFRDIVANVGRVLAPIAENLSAFWDPLLNLGKQLERARVATMEVLRSFEIYNKSFEQFAKTLKPQELQQFSQTGGKELRASLATIANLLRQFGVISEQDFQGTFDELLKVDMDGGKVFKELLDKFLQSDVAKQIGEFIGTLIGTILSEISQVTGFLSGRIKGMSQLFEGIKKGFNAAGGPAAFSNIFKDIFGMLFRGLVEVAKMLPMEAYIVAGLMATLPVAIQTFSMILAQKISDVFLGGRLADKLTGDGLFDRARQTYLLDKAKAQTGFAPGGKGSGAKNAFATTADDLAKTAKGEDFIPLSKAKVTTISQDIAEMTAKILPEEAIKSKDFPNVALGTYKPVEIGGQYSTTDMFRRMPKPAKQPKGFEWLKNFIIGDGGKAKDLGKNLRIAGGELAEGFTKQLGKGRNFLGGLPGRMGAGGMAGLKNPIGMLDKFGTALSVVTGVLNGISTFFTTGDIWKSLGATAGPIIGNILGFAIAGPIGAMVGGWLFSTEQAVQAFADIFRNVGQSLTGLFDTLGQFGSAIIQATGALLGAKDEGQSLQKLFVLLKMAMFPVTATLQLLDMGLRAAYIAFLRIDKWVNETFQGGDRRGRIQAAIDKAQTEQMTALYRNHEYYVSWSRGEGQKATLGGKSVTWKGGQWVDEKGNRVEGGTTPQQKPSPIFTQPGAPAPGATQPVAATLPAPTQTNQQTQQLLTDAKQTATQVAQLNTKAAQQVTQGASIQKSTDETKKNTTTANTTLGNIKAGIMTISNKLTGIQNAMLADLNNIQAGVTSISSLLSSGALKVKFSLADGSYGMGGGGAGYGGGGVALAGMLGNWMKDTGGAPGSIWEHPWHGGIKAKHADGSLHYAGRAIDIGAYAHEQGPILARIAQFNKMMGLTPTQLFHAGNDPKGHGDHVHVAYAGGIGNGVAFNTLPGAEQWERSMVAGSVKVASVTSNSTEGFGNHVGNLNVTVNAGNISDPDTVADVVAQRILSAMQNPDSIFV